MYHKLTTIILKSGESLELGRVRAPDADWAERVEHLLGHKEPMWLWQNSSLMRHDLGLEAYYYLLHRDGSPLANIMTVEHQGVGYFGHVWTQPEDRRKGAAKLLMSELMEDFKKRGGEALFLSTTFDSPAYHIYAHLGFDSIEKGSGLMAYYAADEATFYHHYYSGKATQIRDIQWSDWAASAALFLGDFPSTVRNLGMGLIARSSAEASFMELLHRQEKDTSTSIAKVLVCEQSGAVAGLATWSWDPLWPNTCLLDFFLHPSHSQETDRLLGALELPRAERYLAYCDAGDNAKQSALTAFGFRSVGTLTRYVAIDHLRTNFADVDIWERL